ncbi:hypothetical protein CR513_35042, partial [Mucuna pruriens]
MPNLARRMTGWVIELSEFDIAYERKGHMKAQVLANFINELTINSNDEEAPKENREWTLYVDKSSNKRGSGAGVILEGSSGFLRFGFYASNNHAEYEALLVRIRLAKELGATRLILKSDSQLVPRQVNNKYQERDLQLIQYLCAVLCNDWQSSWHDPIINYLNMNIMPEDPQEVRRIKRETIKYANCISEVFLFLYYGVWEKLKRSEPLRRFMRGRVEATLEEGGIACNLSKNVISVGVMPTSIRRHLNNAIQ